MNDLVDLLTDRDGDPLHAASRRVSGVAVGIVVDNKDPDNFGRVKVKFPWLGDESESEWAKVATPMGGKDRGIYFLPEKDEEVLVAFEQGDLDHPFVIGGLWSTEDKPPENNADGKNNIRKIRSRSGHEIVFDDDGETGQEKVTIHTKAGHKLVLDDSTGSEKIELIDKSGQQKLQMDSNQNSITLESAMTLTIKAVQIEINASGILTLKGGLVKIN